MSKISELHYMQCHYLSQTHNWSLAYHIN